MICQELIEQLGGYLDGEIAWLIRSECEEHVRRCPGCWRLVESCKHTILVYRRQPAPELPAGLHRRVMERVGGRPPLGPAGNPSH